MTTKTIFAAFLFGFSVSYVYHCFQDGFWPKPCDNSSQPQQELFQGAFDDGYQHGLADGRGVPFFECKDMIDPKPGVNCK